jgi:hypothetical protein
MYNHFQYLEKLAGRKRIRDRGINWKYKYHDKSIPVKKRFDIDIGPGAYQRWEGHDYTTNADYFIVVGPAITKYEKKSFFAGIKRLPPRHDFDKKVYAPSGKYFSNLFAALEHAVKMWGVAFPSGQQNYSQQDLTNVDIPRHVKA